jgi:hypothetical protein
MRPYLRPAMLVVGAMLIVLAARVTKPVCHTATPTATNTPSDFGVNVTEEICDIDLRMPAALAVAGLIAIAGGVMFRPKRA